jgi:hypothetical protein
MDDLFFKTTNGVSDKFLRENHKEYYDNLFVFVKEENISLSERIYLYQNNLSEKPKCQYCKENKTNFIKFYKGYTKYCSRKCAATMTAQNPEVKSKRLSGLEKSNNDPELRKEMTEKANKTKSEFSEERKIEINLKRENSNIEKWGVKIISQSDEIKEKISIKLKNTISEVRKRKVLEKLEQSGFKLLGLTSFEFELNCLKCSNDFKIRRSLFNSRKRFQNDICLICNPVGQSNFEQRVQEWIQTVYDGRIVNNYRGYKKYELDIFLPELNIGIECNGLWWHSEEYKENSYHKDKLKFFEENGVRILNIWEDDWKNKTDIIKSRIINKLGLNKNNIGARKCEIKLVDKINTVKFLNENHIQGNCISSVSIGLYFEGELVSISTFGKLRRNLGWRVVSDGDWELLRFCNKLNYNVSGGLSKLIKFFLKNYKVNRLLSYCDRSFNDGSSYLKVGFTKIKETEPNYYWFHKDVGLRENRWKWRKDVLVSMGYDKKKTEVQILHELGWRRIHDCGSYLFEIKR